MDGSSPPRNWLDPERVTEAIKQLASRIEERFPGATLHDACIELLRVSQQTQCRIARIARPNIWLRAGATIGIAVVIVGLIATVSQLEPYSRPVDVVMFVNLMEAVINNIVLLAVGAFFLVTIETRIKTQRALVALHELRSLAHVIDMHQLTKDPDRVLFKGGNTESSPVTNMGVYEMSRYLDYCCEMLSLAGKIAAIYGMQWRDSIALQAVNDVEHLTTGMSQKIFQKVMILHGSHDTSMFAVASGNCELPATTEFSQPFKQATR